MFIWTRSGIRRHFPELAALAKSLHTASWISNLVRYAAVLKFGGIYTDTDIFPFKSIDTLFMQNKPFVTCENPPAKSPEESIIEDNCTLFCNAIGASAGDKGLEKLYRIVERSKSYDKRQPYTLMVSGPPLFTEVLKGDKSYSVLVSGTFFPCDWKDKSKCDASKYKERNDTYAMHQWAKSWWRSG